MHPVFEVTNFSNFSFSVRRAIVLAARGSAQAFATVRSLMIQNRGSAHQFIPVIFANLDPSRIPDPDVLASSEAGSSVRSSVTMAIRALEALLLCTSELPEEAYSEFWQRLWIWVQFIDVHGLHSPMDEFLYKGVTLMLFFLDGTSTSSAKLMMPEARVFVSRAWVVLVSRAELGLNTMDSVPIELPMLVLADFLDSCHSSPSHVADFAEGVGGIDDLACLIVRYIAILPRTPAAEISAPQRRLRSTLEFVGHAASSTGKLHALREPLMSSGIVRALTAVLYNLSESGRKPLLHRCLDILMSFIQPAGSAKIREALDAGLLPALITCCGRGWAKNHAVSVNLTRFLATILPLSTVHRPVLVALERALPTVGNLQETPSFVASACFKVWDDFVTLAQERLQVLRRFRTEGYISRGACDNIECGVIKERREFKRCSGCRDHLYCSPHCQTIAWKKQPEGHRATCNARRQLPNLNFDSRPLGETKRDHLFRLFLLQSDYRRLKLTILLQKLAHIHKTTDTNFCTIFAYGSTSCITRVDAAEKWGQVVPNTEPRIALSSGRMELHLVLTGGANCSPILFRSSTSELTEGLVRIAGKIPPGTDISELHVRFPQLFEEVQRLSNLRVVETHG
ncbi:hypothetical protein C8R44DRAFT_845723 [Mycena epipterygia]|nr:hypothetical protein C8R44DRAFT_845723 [Mycena epipterygia]